MLRSHVQSCRQNQSQARRQLALTRSSHTLLFTRHTAEPTPYLSELQQTLKQHARKSV